ncbi:VOC family protein [Chitinophagaceae bacterium LWZ2-11]
MATLTTEQKITPFLWFDGNVEEAVDFYTSTFKNSKIINKRHHGGKVFTATFQLEGQEFMALDGGPQFKFSHAVSFFVKCKTQEEVDELWEKLSAGGEQEQCGWLKDKFGLSWQIIPDALGKFLSDPDPAKSQRAMRAMLKMHKIDIQLLQDAYDGK